MIDCTRTNKTRHQKKKCTHPTVFYS
jgi:hypothetical protein